jgi:tetratricopeptide (TPR) repeat protein
MKRFLPLFLLIAFVISATPGYCQSKKDYQTIADSLYENKDYKGAIENFTKAINDSKKNKALLVTLLDKRALAEIDTDLYKDAIKDEITALSVDPNYGDAYWNLGRAYDSIGDYQLAIDNFTRALSYNAGNKRNLSTLYNNIGNALRNLKKYKEAIYNYNQSIDLNKRNKYANWNRGLAYELNGDYQLAADDYTAAMFNNQDNQKFIALLYANRANVKIKQKQYQEGINDLNTAIRMNPVNGNFYKDRGQAYRNNGDYQLAINDYTTAIPFFNNNKEGLARLYHNRAINEADIHQYKKALEDINNAIALDPQKGYMHWTRGGIYSEQGDCMHAIENFTKALDFYQNDKEVLAILHRHNAANYYILKENKKSMDECNLAIILNPNDQSSYFTRGKLYAKRLSNKERAMADFNKVMELDTSKATVSYIFSQFYTGHQDVALALLQQQVLKTPNPDDVLNHYYNIACVFSIMNKPEEANIYLKKAIDSGYSKKFAANDEDFDNIRKTPDYIATMANNNAAK